MIHRGYSGICWAAVIAAVLLWPYRTVAASTELTISSGRQFEFAQTLFQNGQYRRAAEEFQRFVFFFPEDAKRGKAEFQAADALRRAGDLAAAVHAFQTIIRSGDDHPDSEAVESYFMLADCYRQMRSPSQALLQLHNLLAISDDPRIHDRAYFQIGWIAADQSDWEGARRAWSRISDAGRPPRGRLIEALKGADHLNHKSPGLAGALSIIPGLGQLYLGRGQDALVALVITGGTLGASYEAFDNDLPALGTLLALVGAGFYAGNIYGAVSGAHKYNRMTADAFSEDLRRRFDPHRPMGFIDRRPYLCLQLKIAF